MNKIQVADKLIKYIDLHFENAKLNEFVNEYKNSPDIIDLSSWLLAALEHIDDYGDPSQLFGKHDGLEDWYNQEKLVLSERTKREKEVALSKLTDREKKLLGIRL